MLDNIGKVVHFRETLDNQDYGHANSFKAFEVLYWTEGKDLIKPSKIKLASPFLTLENMVLQKQNLKEAFLSPEWKDSVWSSS